MIQRNYRGISLINYKQTLKLNPIQKEILIGTLLGDASMAQRNGKALYRVKFEQSLKNQNYINHLYEIFKPFVGTPPKIRCVNKEKTIQSVYFQTYSHSCFVFYFNLFYNIKQKENKYYCLKQINQDLCNFLTPRSLAY